MLVPKASLPTPAPKLPPPIFLTSQYHLPFLTPIVPALPNQFTPDAHSNLCPAPANVKLVFSLWFLLGKQKTLLGLSWDKVKFPPTLVKLLLPAEASVNAALSLNNQKPFVP